MRTKQDIEIFGVELEIEYHHYKGEPTTHDYQGSDEEFEIIDIKHNGGSVYDMVSEINGWEQKIYDKLKENETTNQNY